MEAGTITMPLGMLIPFVLQENITKQDPRLQWGRPFATTLELEVAKPSTVFGQIVKCGVVYLI
jgi:ABC-type phosphate transport system permease subunit